MFCALFYVHSTCFGNPKTAQLAAVPAAPATSAGLLLAVLMLCSECLLSVNRESRFGTQEGHKMQGLPKVETKAGLRSTVLADTGFQSTLDQGLRASAGQTGAALSAYAERKFDRCDMLKPSPSPLHRWCTLQGPRADQECSLALCLPARSPHEW